MVSPISSQGLLSSSNQESSYSTQQLPPTSNNNNNNDNSVFSGIVFQQVDHQGLLNGDVDKINIVALSAITKSRDDESQAWRK